jgi:Ser/Thr protein kinase RdoA (MazF antagonist)
MSFPASYSTLSAGALLQLAVQQYGLPLQSSITFLKRGFNDTYRVDAGKERYILRVYKHGKRSLESIRTELALVHDLSQNGISISTGIPDVKKELIQTIDAPEGIRYAVLFSFAEGMQVRKLSKEQSYALGAETAKMHLLTMNKELGETAQDYAIEYQLDKTLRVLKPVLNNHPEAYHYLVQLQDDFLEIFRSIDKNELSAGICHGDLQAENFHLSDDTFTFFDLDFFGKAYLIYDIGVFCWYDHKNKPKEIRDAFLAGYQSRKKLTETELRLIPYFSTLRALFQMTLYCELSDGKELPLWPAQQVAEFVEKVRKWHSSVNSRQ